jgi:hypothetical protein
VLALAGLFPFGRLKYHCPDKCRTPLGFVSHHWGGRTPLRDAFRLGLHHGACCVGCLLGADAADVRGRHWQRRMDARASQAETFRLSVHSPNGFSRRRSIPSSSLSNGRWVISRMSSIVCRWTGITFSKVG